MHSMYMHAISYSLHIYYILLMHALIIFYAYVYMYTYIGIEMFKKMMDYGQAGDNVGILLRGVYALW